jgi:PPOX class F420-dependent enzyme/OxyR family protein
LESIYSEPEIQYLKSQRLARIATATRQGKPDVSPVAFEFDGMHFFIGSHSQDIFLSTRKYKNVRDGNKVRLWDVLRKYAMPPWSITSSEIGIIIVIALKRMRKN